MPCPTLSPIERQRIAAAAKAAAEGQRVKWKAFGRKLWYEIGGKQHLVTSAPNRRVFEALCRQAEIEYANQKERAAEEAKKAAQRPVAKREQKALDCEPALPDNGAPVAVLPCDEQRHELEGIG